jgi:hypothetical protein
MNSSIRLKDTDCYFFLKKVTLVIINIFLKKLVNFVFLTKIG